MHAPQVFPARCVPFTRDVVVPSRTPVVTDLVFHFTASALLLTRAAIGCALGYPGRCATRIEGSGFQRAVARREVTALLERDFDRLVMAHGEVIEESGKEALRGAQGGLGL